MKRAVLRSFFVFTSDSNLAVKLARCAAVGSSLINCVSIKERLKTCSSTSVALYKVERKRSAATAASMASVVTAFVLAQSAASLRMRGTNSTALSESRFEHTLVSQQAAARRYTFKS